MSAPQPNDSSPPTSSTHDVFQTIASGMLPPDSISALSDPQWADSIPSEPAAKPPTSDGTLSRNRVPLSWLWLREHDQAFVGVCVAVFLVLTGYHWAKLSGWGAVPLEIDRQAVRRYDYKIDINSATLIEWTQIEGIGDATAQKILDDRAAHGPFRDIADLQRVKGIGPATVAKIRPYVRDSLVRTSPAVATDSGIDSDRP